MYIKLQTNNQIGLGIFFKLINLAIFTIISLGLLTKSKMNTPLEEFFIICIYGIIWLLPWVIWTRAKYLKTKNYLWYIIRALCSIVGMVTWIEALKRLGPNEATLTSYLIPLFTLVFANIFKEEKVNKIILLAISVCIIVLFFTLKIQLLKFELIGLLMALTSAISWALYEVSCKKQSYSEHYLTQAFYTFLFASIIMLPFLIGKDMVDKIIANKELGVLGLLRVLNIICVFLAYKFAPINILSPFSYTRLVFMVIGSFLVLHIIPSINIILASLVIISINVYIFQILKKGKLKIKEINSGNKVKQDG